MTFETLVQRDTERHERVTRVLGASIISRIWRAATRKRAAEYQASFDARLTAAIENHACTGVSKDGILCGLPLDENGLCEEHQ